MRTSPTRTVAPIMEEPATVLLVESDPAFGDLIAEVLADEGLVVLLARSSAEALQLAREQLPDAVVLDLHLPGRPGFEVLDDLRRHPTTRDIPVLLTSGMAAPATVPRPVDAAALLPKPFDLDLLLEHVWRAITARVHGLRATETRRLRGAARAEGGPGSAAAGATALSRPAPDAEGCAWKPLA